MYKIYYHTYIQKKGGSIKHLSWIRRQIFPYWNEIRKYFKKDPNLSYLV